MPPFRVQRQPQNVLPLFFQADKTLTPLKVSVLYFPISFFFSSSFLQHQTSRGKGQGRKTLWKPFHLFLPQIPTGVSHLSRGCRCMVFPSHPLAPGIWMQGSSKCSITSPSLSAPIKINQPKLHHSLSLKAPSLSRGKSSRAQLSPKWLSHRSCRDFKKRHGNVALGDVVWW